jgi:uncharacterized protein
VALIVDTGPLVAMLDATDPDHERCAELLASTREPRIVPVCVLVELEYLLRPWPAAFAVFVNDIRSGAFELLQLAPASLARASELIERYQDLSLGLVDATVVVAAEMLNETKVATLDHRDFGAVQPAHAPALTLLP